MGPGTVPSRAHLTSLAFCALAALFGLGFTVLVFHPGFMSRDSLNQLVQGRSGIYNSEHPPLMAWLWGRLDSVVAGPLPMLLLQNLMFWSGLALALGLSTRLPFSPIAVLAIGLFPTNLALLGTVWKDVQMGASLLFAFGVILLAQRTRRRWILCLAIVPLWYACAVRHNGAVTAFPLFAFWSWVLWNGCPPRARAIRSAATSAALVLGVVASVLYLNGALTHHVSKFEFQEAPLHDLIAISLAENQNLLPEYLQSGPRAFPLDRMRELYFPAGVNPLYDPRTPGPGLALSTSAPEMAVLLATWFKAVREHPIDYLRHRLRYCEALLGTLTAVCYPFHPGIDDNDLGFRWNPSRLGRFTLRQLEQVRNTLAFRGWFFCLCIVAALLVAKVRPPADLAAFHALAMSGLLNVLPFLVLGPNCDFRFLWWTCACALLLPTLGWGRILSRIPAADARDDPKGAEGPA